MRIPKIIKRKEHEYIYVKTYPNFVLYQDMITGTRECFSRFDLGLVQSKRINQGPRIRIKTTEEEKKNGKSRHI